MTVTPGSRLGPYEILSAIGAGGMGEVWKARDTRLDRSVAVKVLPGDFASNAQLRLRFEREAKTISQLSHPHICTLYDVGSEAGVEYLVMELLEGESLADRITRGPLPIEQVLRYGVEIAEALEKAHRAGVVHRDLKPGNVMITKSGAKLLDFGLAKAAVAPLATMSTAVGTMAMATENKPLTQEGTIVGTFQYMAPEQIEGREADARTDIFAFGALLYEMATGKRAFDAKSRASLIASILDREPPPVSAVQPIAPRAFDRVVQMCLKKEPDDRWQSAHDIAAELRWIAGSDADEIVPAKRSRRTTALLSTLLGLLIVAVALLAAFAARRRNTEAPVVRFGILPPPNTRWTGYNSMSISPDGRHVVFFATAQDPRGQLFLRNLDSMTTQPLPGTEDASFPFWSPDGKWIAFFTPAKLKKISLAGGPPQVLCDAVTGPGAGGSWNEAGDIIFAAAPRSYLQRVSSSGGIPVRLFDLDTAAGERSQDWPQFLPDGRHFIYRSGRPAQDSLVAASLDPHEPRHVVLPNVEAALFAPPRHLLYVRERTALVQEFDTRKALVTGDAYPIAEQLGYNGATGYAAFAYSPAGTLLYRAGGGDAISQLAWLDRSGKTLSVLPPIGTLGEPAIAPDGRRIAYSMTDSATSRVNLWVLDTVRGTNTRLTFEIGDSTAPHWSPDGTRLIYTFHADTKDPVILQRPASGLGTATVVTGGSGVTIDDWSLDGRYVLFEYVGQSRIDIGAIELATGRRVAAVNGPARDWEGRFSPDAKFVAYCSNEGGRPEVYVQPFPPNGAKWQISSAGGVQPVWTHGGRELLYLDLSGRLISAAITADNGGFAAGVPVPLFNASFAGNVDDFRHFDIAADGERILFDPEVAQKEPAPITVVLNWTSTLPK